MVKQLSIILEGPLVCLDNQEMLIRVPLDGDGNITVGSARVDRRLRTGSDTWRPVHMPVEVRLESA